MNTDRWSSESTHLGHCANPHSPSKKIKRTYFTYSRLALQLSLPRKTIPFWNTKAKTQSGTNAHGVMLCYFMFPKKEKYSKYKFSDYYSNRQLHPRFFLNFNFLLQWGSQISKNSWALTKQYSVSSTALAFNVKFSPVLTLRCPMLFVHYFGVHDDNIEKKGFVNFKMLYIKQKGLMIIHCFHFYYFTPWYFNTEKQICIIVSLSGLLNPILSIKIAYENGSSGLCLKSILCVFQNHLIKEETVYQQVLVKRVPRWLLEEWRNTKLKQSIYCS